MHVVDSLIDTPCVFQRLSTTFNDFQRLSHDPSIHAPWNAPADFLSWNTKREQGKMRRKSSITNVEFVLSTPELFPPRQLVRFQGTPMPMQFNIDRKDQFVTVTPDPHLNPAESATFEANCCLMDEGDNPTVLARPAGVAWSSPYCVYRIGFQGESRLPEFQLLFQGESELTTVRGDQPIGLNQSTHLAGTFDGKTVRLFVDGVEVASLDKSGLLATSDQPTVFATRSSTDVGGVFVGMVWEFRIWNVARRQEEIQIWKDHLLPVTPQPEGLVGLWSGEPGPQDDIYDNLTEVGFSQDEILLNHFGQWYMSQYNLIAPKSLKGEARTHFPPEIRLYTWIRARDAYCALYFPDFPDGFLKPGHSVPPGETICTVLDRTGESITEILQAWTDNQVKILRPPIGRLVTMEWATPPDVPNADGHTVNPQFGEQRNTLPKMSISPNVLVESGVVTRVLPGRIRAVSPLVGLPDGSVHRQFTWMFADLWFGEITREDVHLPNTTHFLDADLQIIQWLVDLALTPQEAVDDAPNSVIQMITQILSQFEELINRPEVDEVRDIQPFLSDRRHWMLLSPTGKHVWPQKMLGNKYKVDFVIREHDDSYVAVEIESPRFKLFTNNLDPRHELTHAEQQVRDYCDYIDRNRDCVEREEGLPQIYRPNGLVIIGRKKDLVPQAMRKLESRNRDGGRFTVMVYDDLIQRLRAVLDSVVRALGAV
jgi:hypothetical protein